MPAEKSPSDPSMEEIIASISRIIAEEKQPTDRQVGTKAVRRVSPWAELATAPSGAPDAPAASPADAARLIEPQPLHAGAAPEPTLDSGRERIVSAASSGAAAVKIFPQRLQRRLSSSYTVPSIGACPLRRSRR